MTTVLDFTPLVLSLKLACVTTALLLLTGIPLAWWLVVGRRTWYKPIIESLVALPLVLPPTVLGFYLLVLLGQGGIIGNFVYVHTGIQLAFSFTGLVLGSCIYSLPFVVQPLQTAFAGVNASQREAAHTLGSSDWKYFFAIHLPLSRRGVFAATVLGFAHTLGEFGVVLMLGGNIPQETQVISIAIYDLVERLEYTQAHVLSLILLGVAFLVMWTVFAREGQHKWR